MPTRRRFLDGLLGTAAAGTLAAVVYPLLRYLKPLPASGVSGPTRLTRAETEKLERSNFVVVPAGGKRVIVLRGPQGQLHALDAKCTHEGCTVQYVPGEGDIWCACHNGRFNLDGRVLSGPPPRPLSVYTVHSDQDGSILVTVTA